MIENAFRVLNDIERLLAGALWRAYSVARMPQFCQSEEISN